MTELQAIQANIASGKKKSVEDSLSPRQKELLKIINKNPKAGWKTMIRRTDLVKAWAEVEKKIEEIRKAEENEEEEF